MIPLALDVPTSRRGLALLSRLSAFLVAFLTVATPLPLPSPKNPTISRNFLLPPASNNMKTTTAPPRRAARKEAETWDAK